MHKIKKVIDTKTFIEESKRLYGNKFSYLKTNYINYRTPVTITCKKHGDFTVLPGRHLDKRNKSGCCPVCARITSAADKTETFKKKIVEHFPDSYVNYDKTFFLGTHVPTEIECPYHGIQKIIPNSYLSQKYPCPICGKLKSHDQTNIKQKTAENFKTVCNKIHNFKYDYSKVNYIDDVTPVTVICPEHGEFKVTPNKHKNRGTGCPKCALKISSYPEYILSNLLKENKINFVQQFTIEDSKTKNKPYDFYIPKFNLLIELQGAQHSEKRWNMTDNDLKDRISIDNLKAEISKNHKFNLLQSSKNSVKKLICISNILLESKTFEDVKKLLSKINNIVLILPN